MQALKLYHHHWLTAIFVSASMAVVSAATADDQAIPEVLQPWKDWVTWGVEHRDCPTLYTSADKPICFWPSQLQLSVRGDGGEFATTVNVFEDTWVPLPGSAEAWPMSVRVAQDSVPVVERDGHPAVKLSAGLQELTGEFRWNQMPQRIAIPQQVGLLSLVVDGNEVEIPNWDPDGQLWLKRIRSQPADKDLMGLQIYRLIEDGIPLWLRTEIELTVSGKSREEQLGWVLPLGWKIATVETSIPVAVDERGLMKAQVRAGKWSVLVHAFRTTEPQEFDFAADAQVAANTELVGLKTDPEFRISQLEDVATIDVTQTTFPSKWRNFPVYQWDTAKPFRLVEKMRGMGQQSPPGLSIGRRMWLDEDGKGLTYRDQFRGQMQQIWRLDVADGHELGAVRVDGEAQLITANPKSGASGVEIRRRDLNMEAIGRVDRKAELAATGWQTDADSLQLTLTLPPGWRAFAIFGADQVEGDWLTAWSLLDLFLLLIFSFAVFRMYGVTAGIVALLAFGLGYHELGAPRLTWLFLLMPLALLRVVGDGAGKKWVQAWKHVAFAMLLFVLVPFVAGQIQSVIYPQLERPGLVYGSRGIFAWPGATYVYHERTDQPQVRRPRSSTRAAEKLAQDGPASVQKQVGKSRIDSSNLKYDPKSRIQTGPAQPQWDWNNVNCVWNGPVTSDQRIKPILISLPQHRILTVVRIALLMLLAGILLGGRKIRLPFTKRAAAMTATLFLLILPTGRASAQLPDQQMLDTLRQRLLETPDVFPNAAEIPSVALTIEDNEIEMKNLIHTALDVAVPIPGRLPSWSPVSITMDGNSDVVVTRRDGYLWVLVPKGVHEVVVKGLLPDATDWQWTFALKPRSVVVDAPGWKVTGVDADGVPDSQVFFVKEQETLEDRAAYDRTHFHAIVVVDRHVEIGLISKVHTEVTRLSSPGKAVSLRVPLLDGESVLTSNREVEDGTIAVRLAANQQQVSWDSELPVDTDLRLRAAETDGWVERWHLVTSPIWNVTLEGFRPIYEPGEKDLVPVWHPWPGEEVVMLLSKPSAVSGDIMTVQNVNYQTTLGSRRRNSKLILDLECSLASDFAIQIDAEAEVSSLKINQQSVPVQLDRSRLIVPAQPGKQTVEVQWRKSELMRTRASTSEVTLPVEASNITIVMVMPDHRWILWADGPLRGPAVRFWTILSVAVLAAFALGSVPSSPLRRYEWVLLAIGLTQVHLAAAMLVVGWLFLLAWRGTPKGTLRGVWSFDLTQIVIVFLTAASLIVLMVVVSQGLLGNPDMFIAGNGSSRTFLQWFQPRVGPQLPTASIISISVWFYRLLMLCWALWLATSLLRWLSWGWQQFSAGGCWKRKARRAVIEATPSSN